MDRSVDKTTLRREAQSARRVLHRALPEAGRAIADNFLAAIKLPPAAIVAGYVAMRFEADPAPLLSDLRKSGHAIALPRVVAKATPLAFHLWDEARRPVGGAYDLLEAAPGWPKVSPDVVLVPLLAFDDAGYRLGYGGGYYDRTLRYLREKRTVLAIGLGFSGQRVPSIPRGATDEGLDWLVSEAGTVKFDRASRA